MEIEMSWVYLGFAILAEVAGTISMKLSNGFSKLLPSVLIFVFYGLSMALANLAIKKIDISVVYTIWAGTGTALTAIVGYLWFKENMPPAKIISIGLIILGVIGLSWFGEKN